ncbi:Glu-tRNA(Gln) amidotransferase GatDE subunit E [Candidatus Pacearchaeota archaeon CG10_big_fil_rev_8_21_14_0_10_32_14]|nr:MAG: Glu-tRNA(Gln) amidotransferase GatDE subunit E [Candidatus Pacearchaeota archaeon CG10_big_fil_rev_8_21_14_0_10_32_14]
MEEINYEKLGFKAGLEIHQQLDTKKLFCDCPSILRNDTPDFIVKRKLHAMAGETGEVDAAAKHEAEKEKTFVYQGYHDTNCLIEIDEEPPHPINEEALIIGIQISELLNCKIIPITQIMRKTVVDGSNTSGFQRTVLIAKDGYIETSQGKVGIESVCLEEDAARIVERGENSHEVIYRLDRLGIPLIEIATAPDIKNSECAKEAALKLGGILRSCRVKRGLGTIRQDVNMSVRHGERIEIKGFQDIRNIEKTIEHETLRQIELVKNKKSSSEVRQSLPDFSTKFLRPMPGSARMYPETDLPLLKISRDLINEAKKTLPIVLSKEEMEDELRKTGLSKEMIKLILKEEKVDEFKELLYSAKGLSKNADLIVKMLIMYRKEISTKEKISLEEIENILHEDILEEILKSLSEEKISEGHIKEIMTDIVKGKEFSEAIKKEKVDHHELEEKIHNIIKSKPGYNANAYMGLVMADSQLKGKIDGKTAMEVIQKLLK